MSRQLLHAAPSAEVLHALLALGGAPDSGTPFVRSSVVLGAADVERHINAGRLTAAQYVVRNVRNADELDVVVASTRNRQVLSSVCWNDDLSWETLIRLTVDRNTTVANVACRAISRRIGSSAPVRGDVELRRMLGVVTSPHSTVDEVMALLHAHTPRAVIDALFVRQSLDESMQLFVARHGARSQLVRLSQIPDLSRQAALTILTRATGEFKRTKMRQEIMSERMIEHPEVLAVARQIKDPGLHIRIALSQAALPNETRLDWFATSVERLQHGEPAIAMIRRGVWTPEMLDILDTHYQRWSTPIGGNSQPLLYATPSLVNPCRSRMDVLDRATATSAVFAFCNPHLRDSDREALLDRFGDVIAARFVGAPDIPIGYHPKLAELVLKQYSTTSRMTRWVLETIFSRWLDGMTVDDIEQHRLSTFGRAGSALGRCIEARFGNDPQAWVITAQLADDWECEIGPLIDTVSSIR